MWWMCPRAVVEREITKSKVKTKTKESHHSFSPSRSFFESGLQNWIKKKCSEEEKKTTEALEIVQTDDDEISLVCRVETV